MPGGRPRRGAAVDFGAGAAFVAFFLAGFFFEADAEVFAGAFFFPAAGDLDRFAGVFLVTLAAIEA